ncbi:MAG TPA: FIST N-terminal domain-containing protein, partial [Thermomicrobiales bacterium]|nr:FIST N-terminal domain-containing protein [Thermomicrobiales bacterium]
KETRDRTCAGTVIGCSGIGVAGNGLELEHRPALSLMAFWLPGAKIRPVRIHQENLSLLSDPELWTSLSGVEPADVTSWVVLGDPFRHDVQILLDGLSDLYPGIPVVGGLTSSPRDDRRGWVFLDDRVYDEGGIALAIGGPYRIEPICSHGCDPIGETWTVTGAEKNVLLTISGRPALDVMNDTLKSVPSEKRAAAIENLVVGFAADEYRDEFHRGDYLVRGVIGVDEARGSITVGGKPRCGQTVQFHIRDSEVADIDLEQALTDARALLAGSRPVAGLLFACTARGSALFGSSHHDARALQLAFPLMPAAGTVVCAEIAPAGRRIGIHGLTATIGLLVHDDLVG